MDWIRTKDILVLEVTGLLTAACPLYFFKWANPGLFFVYFRYFQTNNTIFAANHREKMSIQYTAPGFKPTTSQI